MLEFFIKAREKINFQPNKSSCHDFASRPLIFMIFFNDLSSSIIRDKITAERGRRLLKNTAGRTSPVLGADERGRNGCAPIIPA